MVAPYSDFSDRALFELDRSGYLLNGAVVVADYLVGPQRGRGVSASFVVTELDLGYGWRVQLDNGADLTAYESLLRQIVKNRYFGKKLNFSHTSEILMETWQMTNLEVARPRRTIFPGATGRSRVHARLTHVTLRITLSYDQVIPPQGAETPLRGRQPSRRDGGSSDQGAQHSCTP
jgi:hypothetical protein